MNTYYSSDSRDALKLGTVKSRWDTLLIKSYVHVYVCVSVCARVCVHSLLVISDSPEAT